MTRSISQKPGGLRRETVSLPAEEADAGPLHIDRQIRSLERGYPVPWPHWRYHDRYELHLIVQTRGKAFIGDYIGDFEPGHLVLIGPCVPHNWISLDAPLEGVRLRDRALQFGDPLVRRAARIFPEMRAALPLLERACHGIEFFDISPQVRDCLDRMKHSSGLTRLTSFIRILHELTRCRRYQPLSAVCFRPVSPYPPSLHQFSRLVQHIAEHCDKQTLRHELCTQLELSSHQLVRHFSRFSGASLAEFINRLCITRASHLLVETRRSVADICYEAGFNNVSNFNRHFRRLMAMTPTEFRRHAKRA